jgi:DNA-binding transcriptional regulator YiaG
MKTLRERCIPTTTEMPVPIPTADGKGIAKTVMVTVNSITDPTTGEVYLSGEALEELDRVKARHLGVLLPSEIKTLRERLGLTPQRMSDLLSTDEKTYARLESGRERPSESLNRLLVVLWEGRRKGVNPLCGT